MAQSEQGKLIAMAADMEAAPKECLKGILRGMRGSVTQMRNQVAVHQAVARAINITQVQRDYHWLVVEELNARLTIMSDLIVRLEELIMADLEEGGPRHQEQC
jgi:hypothetical protein